MLNQPGGSEYVVLSTDGDGYIRLRGEQGADQSLFVCTWSHQDAAYCDTFHPGFGHFPGRSKVLWCMPSHNRYARSNRARSFA